MDEYVKKSKNLQTLYCNESNQSDSNFSKNNLKNFGLNNVRTSNHKIREQNMGLEKSSECGNYPMGRNPVNSRKQCKSANKDYHLKNNLSYGKNYTNCTYKPMLINQRQNLLNYPNKNGNSNIKESEIIVNNKFDTRDRKNKCIKPKNPVLNFINQRDSLVWQLSHNKYECMICVTNIRAETRTWSCDNCYHIFHIHCIKKWATTCGGGGSSGGGANQDDRDGSKMNLRCPACQKEYSMNVNKAVDDSKGKEWIDYRCFCGKQINPTFTRGGDITPHSCDDTCGKSNRTNDKCPHLCVLMCHPGPCPPCEAIVTRKCQCERTRITAKCNADERTMVCGEKCGKYLNCGVHQCEQLCHPGECDRCEVEIEQKCWCERKSVRIVICGGVEATAAAAQVKGGGEGEYSCDNQCSRTLECGNHQCGEICHSGDCTPCSLTVDKISRCWCKKSSIDELDASCQRESCVDPVPSCGEVCERIIDSCGHVCSRICHEGQCGPCPLTRDVVCRCGKTTQVGLACSSLNDNDADDDETNHQHRSAVLCNKVCNKKLSCGRHRCSEKCCASELHICFRPCGRTLSCKSHQCERECGHLGLCPSCPNVSFDELHCECGAVTLLPPVACGQSPPVCNRVCSRQHECSHPVRHNCHNKESCPPCTDLVSKPCPGAHKTMDNVPCFRAVATCGLPCGRRLSNCKHFCVQICHAGDCISNDKCTQPCGNLLVCGHSCPIPCHDNDDCNSLNIDCSVPVSVECKCGLRSLEFSCSLLHNFKSTPPDQLLVNDLFYCREKERAVEQLHLICNDMCRNAQFLANKLRSVISTLPITNYSLLHKYYSAYFEDFSRKNFNFLVSVEKIFQALSQQNSSHRFSLISVDKAKFISRFSICYYKLNSKVAYNFEMNTANVIVEFAVNKTNIPKILLSKTVEDKYFKIFKPSF